MPKQSRNTAPTSRTCAIRSYCRDVSEHFRSGGLVCSPASSRRRAARCGPCQRRAVAAVLCDKMNGWAQSERNPGLGYIFWREGEEGGTGPVAKNIGAQRANAIREQLRLKPGDAVFFVAGDPSAFYKFAGLVWNKVADELGLSDKEQFAFCWIVDFPMYEWSEDEKKIEFSHNPFSMPNYDHEAFLKLDASDRATIEKITAFQYDIVCNGVELSSGAIQKPQARRHDQGIRARGLWTRSG